MFAVRATSVRRFSFNCGEGAVQVTTAALRVLAGDPFLDGAQCCELPQPTSEKSAIKSGGTNSVWHRIAWKPTKAEQAHFSFSMKAVKRTAGARGGSQEGRAWLPKRGCLCEVLRV